MQNHEIEFAPKLPITNLENALAVYKEWIRPLLWDDQMAQVERIVADFGQNGGPDLAEKLQDYVESLPNNENWMAPFWTKMYLSMRDSLLTESNYVLHLTKLGQDGVQDNDLFMAHWILSVARIYLQLKNDNQATYNEGGHIFCNLNTQNLLGCARIPHEKEDLWVNYPHFLKNIAVFANNQCFILPIFNEAGEAFSDIDIARQLQKIKKETGHSSCEFVTSAFQGSDTCTAFLNDFLPCGGNQFAFDSLNETIFHVVLMQENFIPDSSHCMDMLFTLPHVHWCYKPITFLLWENNEISGYMEHTGADGVSMMHLLDLAKISFLQTPVHKNLAPKDSLNYYPLFWQYSGADRAKLGKFYQWYKKKVESYSLKIYDFDITSPHFSKCSHDALAHTIMQYGMQKILDKPQSIYASCAMGHFREGRTEAMRTVSQEIQDFIFELANKGEFNSLLFDRAMQEHKNRIKLCKHGLAPSRYLQGLTWISEGKFQKIEFFTSPLTRCLGTNYFSTSNIGTLDDLCSQFFFSPPAPSRFGFGYLTNESKIRFCISYHKEDNDLLAQMISAFDEFYTRTK